MPRFAPTYFFCLLCFFTGAALSGNKDELRAQLNKAKTIGVYTIPSTRKGFDPMVSNLAGLKLLSMGYDIQGLHSGHLDSLISDRAPRRAQKVAEIISAELRDIPDILMIFSPSWKRREGAVAGTGTLGYYKGTIHELDLEVQLFEKDGLEEIYSTSNSGETMFLKDNTRENTFFVEPSSIVIERTLSTILKEVPIRKRRDTVHVAHHFPLLIYGDKRYRELYGDEWQVKMALRVQLVNSILRKQCELEFDIVGFTEWERTYEPPFDQMLSHLAEDTRDVKDAFIIGVTNDPSLADYWGDRHQLGLAEYFGRHAIIKDIPVFPDVVEWDPIEEALIILHEVGHMFGACHTRNESSLMTPMAGSMSFSFGNAAIAAMGATLDGFLRRSDVDRFDAFLPAAINAHCGSGEHRFMAIEEAAILISSSSRRWEKQGITLQCHFADSIIHDSASRHALQGYFHFIAGELDVAGSEFLRTVFLDPDFGNAYEYLSEIYKRQGNAKESEKYRVLADQRVPKPVIDE